MTKLIAWAAQLDPTPEQKAYFEGNGYNVIRAFPHGYRVTSANELANLCRSACGEREPDIIFVALSHQINSNLPRRTAATVIQCPPDHLGGTAFVQILGSVLVTRQWGLADCAATDQPVDNDPANSV